MFVAELFMLVLMPSMLFSGAVLDRSGLPDWLYVVTSGLPLTFLTHAIQEVAKTGASTVVADGYVGVAGKTGK